MASGSVGPPVKKQRSSGKKETEQICIVHFEGLQHGDIKLLSSCENPEERLSKLHDIRRKRMAQPVGSVHRMEQACSLIPDTLQSKHGYHVVCYKRFTMNLDRLKDLPFDPQPSTSRTCRSSSTDQIIFNPDCIFCNSCSRKKIKVKGTWTTEGLSVFDRDGGKAVLAMAEKKQDHKLLTRICGYDLFSCEAKYHKSCRTSYIQNPQKWRSSDEEEKKKQQSLEQSHAVAFECVCRVVDEDVLRMKKILKLTDLCSLYVCTLAKSPHPNPQYRGENLKTKLEKHYCDSVSFCSLGRFHSYILYSKDIDINQAIKYSYELGSKDMIEEAGTQLHQEIISAFNSSDELKWPPTAQDLQRDMENILPPMLEKFLSYVLFGKSSSSSERSQRLLSSIGQDICRAATNSQWNLPKHMLLCLTLRHMFRSERLITMLNRLGHSESYSFALELETAIAKAADQSSHLLSSQIVRNPGPQCLFHSEFDNFDQFINDLSGSGSIHTAHGIMLQEVSGGEGITVDAPTVERSGQRSLNVEEVFLPECYVNARRDPKLQIKQVCYSEGPPAMATSKQRQALWLFGRVMYKDEHIVPALPGFISQTGTVPEKLTVIDYYPVIPKPITEYSTVQECLKCAEQATSEVNQPYVITTFDLGVCMKAYPLVWNYEEKYQKHIIMLGSFHLICAYLRMVGKKMAGSGLSDVFLEAGLITSGSLDGVLKGKNYDRAMHCHMVLMEALEQLLLEKFLSSKGDDQQLLTLLGETQDANTIKNLFISPGSDSLEEALKNEGIMKLVDEYLDYRREVAQGSIGKTAQFWISYMNHIGLVLSLLEAVKDNNFYLYAHCLHMMPDLFFSYGGQNYARYLTYFSVFLANLETTHPGALNLIKLGAFSVARSFIPGSRTDVDKTMEETFMRHAKSHGGCKGSGVTGLLTNFAAYQRWVRSTHARSQYLSATMHMTGMERGSVDNKHRDIRPTEVNRSETHVHKAKEAVKSFINPFDMETTELVVLSSGATVPEGLAADVLRAETAGAEAKNEFVASRLKTGKDFFQPVKRLNLKTLESMKKTVKVKASNNKVVQYKQQVNIVFQLFVKYHRNENSQLDLAELLKYPLTPVPYNLATADGFLAKTDKAKAYHHVAKGVENATLPQLNETITICDGNAAFYTMKEVPGTFRLICQKLFDQMPQGDVIFSTDSYHPESIKSMERQRRGTSDKFIIKGESTKRPADWKAFLANDVNKKQFIELLHREWTKDEYAPKLKDRHVTLICNGTATMLTSKDGHTTKETIIRQLQSSQEESDTRMVLYCQYASSKGYNFCRVKSPDTDVFFILLHFATKLQGITVLFDTGTGNNHRLLNITELAKAYTPEYCTSLMVLHAYSGSDTTSAFKGQGKVKPIKTLQKNPNYAASLSKLGDSWSVADELVNELEAFTCAMYGKHRMKSVDAVRHAKINELCSDNEIIPSKNVEIGSLPPCRQSLVQHILRTNYQVGIWKRALIADPQVPSPVGHGWIKVGDILEPMWYEGSMLPQQLIDISVDITDEGGNEDDSDTEMEYGTFDFNQEINVDSDSDED